jgi:hypothetical protein
MSEEQIAVGHLDWWSIGSPIRFIADADDPTLPGGREVGGTLAGVSFDRDGALLKIYQDGPGDESEWPLDVSTYVVIGQQSMHDVDYGPARIDLRRTEVHRCDHDCPPVGVAGAVPTGEVCTGVTS